MKRSVQEIVELLVFGLIALLLGTGLLWLMGWVFGLAGGVFRFFAGLIWDLLRFVVPVAIFGALVYLIVRLLQQQRSQSRTAEADAQPATSNAPPPPAAPDPGTTSAAEVDATRADVPPAPPVAPAEPAQPETSLPDDRTSWQFPDETPEAAPEDTWGERSTEGNPGTDWTSDTLPGEGSSGGSNDRPSESTSERDVSELWTPPQPAPPAEPERGEWNTPADSEEDDDRNRF